MSIREICKHLVPDCLVKIISTSNSGKKYYVEEKLAGEIVADKSDFYDNQKIDDWTLYHDHFLIIL